MKMLLLRVLGPALAGLAIGFVIQGWRMDAAVSTLKAKHQAEVSASIALAHDETIRLQRIKDEAIANAQKLADANARAARNARTELDRLRDQLKSDTSSVSQATYESLVKYTATLQAVFGECGRELEDMAKTADGHALDAKVLKESWGGN
jgi:vacuolar-type H+-ATPase subunit E/Vma4